MFGILHLKEVGVEQKKGAVENVCLCCYSPRKDL